MAEVRGDRVTPSGLKFRICGIGTALGREEIKFELDPSLKDVAEKTGIASVWKTDKGLVDLALEAVESIQDFEMIRPTIRCLVVVTQSHEYFLPPAAAALHNRLGLASEVPSFDVGQGCSGFAQGLAMCVRISQTMGPILLVCADKYRSKIAADDRSTFVIFSDAASATVISSEPTNELLVDRHLTDGSGFRFIRQNSLHPDEDHCLHMSGTDVFMFTIKRVVDQIRTLMTEAAGLGISVETLYLHQASQLVIDGIQKRINFEGRIPVNLSVLGNTVSSSIPFLLSSDLDRFSKSTSVISGFGLGLSASSLLISPAT